jgi:anti-sigma regulatory factor (Ser/Thr protein kinase)
VPLATTLTNARLLLDTQPPRVARNHDLPNHPMAPELARAALAAACEDWELNAGLYEAAMTVTTELVSNAVEHAATASILHLSLDQKRLQIAVRDNSPATPGHPQITVPGERGYGLLIVRGLSRRWGVTPHPSGQDRVGTARRRARPARLTGPCTSEPTRPPAAVPYRSRTSSRAKSGGCAAVVVVLASDVFERASSLEAGRGSDDGEARGRPDPGGRAAGRDRHDRRSGPGSSPAPTSVAVLPDGRAAFVTPAVGRLGVVSSTAGPAGAATGRADDRGRAGRGGRFSGRSWTGAGQSMAVRGHARGFGTSARHDVSP